MRHLKQLLFFILFVNISYTALSQEMYSVFPGTVKNGLSTAARLIFQSEYPINTDALRTTSPRYLDDDGNISNASPHFYVVPDQYLGDSLDVSRHSIECQIFVGDSNKLTILPTKPYDYNTSYSVFFQDFPVYIPDISQPNGYRNGTLTKTFQNCFTTIDYPLHISSISFEANKNVIWCKEDTILVTFNKDIDLPASLLDSLVSEMFYLKLVKDTIIGGDTLLTQTINFSASCSGNTVSIVPISPFVSGDYFLGSRLDKFIGDDYYNREYPFRVANELVVRSEAYSSTGDNLPLNCRNGGFEAYKIYEIGDTVHLSYPFLTEDESYYLEAVELPSGLVYESGSSISTISFVLSCVNLRILSASNFIDNGLKVRFRYASNPIDTLVLEMEGHELANSVCPGYSSNFELSNCKEKLFDHKFTYYRYSREPMILSNTSICLWEMGGYKTKYFPISSEHTGSLDTIDGEIEIDRPFVEGVPTRVGNEVYFITGTGTIHIGTITYLDNYCNNYSYSMHVTFNGFNDTYEGGTIIDPTVANSFFKIKLLESVNQKFVTPAFLNQSTYLAEGISTPAQSISFSVELADAYKDDYEIYYATSLGQVHYGISKNWQENLELGTDQVSGTLRCNQSECYSKLHIQVRRKIVEFEYSVVRCDKQGNILYNKCVPTYDEVHFAFNPEPLNIEETQLVSNGGGFSDKVFVLRHTPERGTEYIGGDSLDVPIQEKSSVYYYKNTKITAKPYIEEKAGCKLHSIHKPTQAYTMSADSAITLTLVNKKDTAQILAGYGFILEYIQVENRCSHSWDYYSVQESSNRRGVASWQETFDDNRSADNGVGMFSPLNLGKHRHTTELRFIFSENFDVSSAKANIKIEDIPSGSEVLRYDSIPLGKYEYDYYNHGRGSVVESFFVKLSHQAQNSDGSSHWHAMSHLQNFRITITNTPDSHIRSYCETGPGERMANFKDGGVFTAITMPPRILIHNRRFHNESIKDDHWWDLFGLCPEPEIVINNFMLTDVIGNILTPQKLSEIIKDDENRTDFEFYNRRFPDTSSPYWDGNRPPETIYWNVPMYENKKLKELQRIVSVYNWAEVDNNDTSMVVDTTLNDLAEGLVSIGVGNTELNTGIAKIISAVYRLFASNDITNEASNSFWLDKDGNEMNPKYDHNGKLIDWELWGVGKYGLYTDKMSTYGGVERTAYSEGFEYVYSDTGEPEIVSKGKCWTTIEIIVNDANQY